MLYLCCLPLVSTFFLLDAVIPHLMRDLYRFLFSVTIYPINRSMRRGTPRLY